MKSLIMAAIAALFFASLANPANAMSKKQTQVKVKIEQSVEFSARRHRHHRRHHVRRSRHHTRAVQDANGNFAGLVTVSTAAGINITCSSAFASEAAGLIAAAVAQGIKFSRITCYSRAGSHVSGSNHHAGNAFDSHPSIPAALVRQHGLRSGCDFRDCPHVDNARNVGGVAFWNSVKHRQYAGGRDRTYSAHRHRHRRIRYADRRASIETMTLSAKSRSNTGLISTINAKLARWVHPTGKCGAASEQLATYYWHGQRVASGGRFNPHGMTAASRTLPFGTRLNIRNPHNGRSVAVTINDRGPFTNAKIDLSLGAANALGLRQSSYVCVSGG